MARERDGNRLIEHLAELGDEFRHVQQEHERRKAGGATRRALEARMEELAERFLELLSHWVPDPGLRQAWARYFHRGGVRPGEPRLPAPPAFKGVTEAGARVEVRLARDGGYDLIVDGTLERHEAVPWHLDPDVLEPVQVGEHVCREVSDAPAEAVAALARFLATPNAEPPWPWLPALFSDGLVDAEFGLTPRGFRTLGKSAPPPTATETGTTYGVLAADAARARVFVLQAPSGEQMPALTPLRELSETTRPEERTADHELFADTRPGLRREGPHGPRHGVSDHRDHHRREAERRFAAQVVREAEHAWRAHGVTRVVVVASPAMLGDLREAFARAGGPRPWSIHELARDLTRLAPAALQDVLARDGVLPPRGRAEPLHPAPGQPL